MRRPILAALLAVCGFASAASFGLAQDGAQNRTDAAPPAAVSPPELPPLAPPVQPAPTEPPAPAAANQAAEASPPPPEPKAPPAPPAPAPHPVAVLQALDKITAETLRFEARVDEPVRYKDLVITVKACVTRASTEPAGEAAANLDVEDQPDVLPGRRPQTARQVFQGWMFASAPAVHPFEHPIYDVWVIACRTPSPAAPAAPGGASL